MEDYTPKVNQAEFNVTYRCNLACVGCNRLACLPPNTDDMTIEDGELFERQAADRKWKPRMVLVGGEPTLHKDFFGFLDIARRISNNRVTVWSNNYSPETKEILAKVRRDKLASLVPKSFKTRSVDHRHKRFYVAPADYGLPWYRCCEHAAGFMIYSKGLVGTGVSVDHGGYTVCARGGVIDSWLGLGVRTKNLDDLFNLEFAAKQTEELCKHCGCICRFNGMNLPTEKVLGIDMSPTWAKAIKSKIR